MKHDKGKNAKGKPKPRREHGGPAKSGGFKGKPGNGRGQGRHALRDTAIILIQEITSHGELIAVPEEWIDRRRQPPVIYIHESQRGGTAAVVGDRALAHLKRTGAHEYSAQILRILPKESAKPVVGVFVPTPDGGGMIEPVSRKIKESYRIEPGMTCGALAGELVSGEAVGGRTRHGQPHAKVVERLGDARAPHAASLMAIYLNNLRVAFNPAALAEAEQASPPVLAEGREDLRNIPLVTIDGEDARDFDDAVFAEPDHDPANVGGFHLIVAIADVAHYVPDGSALDAEALLRGNSAYFPDRVLPMLPERLSNGLCSLKPAEDRYCLAVHLWIDAEGHTRRYRFLRGLMRSQARLTYTQVETGGSALDASVRGWVSNLNAAYRALSKERDARGTLNINLPEYKVAFDVHGKVQSVAPRAPLESHRLIEAFMIAANVAAADFLLTNKAPGIYRVHEPPSEDKLDDLRRFLEASGYAFPKGAITAAHLNRVLHKSRNAPNMTTIHTAVLRSQMQAYYDNRNVGHFGLSLHHYCHFTSPIRRYADLIVHRSLAALLNKNKGYSASQSLKDIAQHISQTERSAMMAERDSLDRYKIAYVAGLKEKTFAGSIASVNEYGIFVSLKDNGITGFVPVKQLGEDFFNYDPRASSFTGRHSKQSFATGDAITVRVLEADALKSSLIFKPDAGGEREHPKKHRPRHPQQGPNRSKHAPKKRER